MRLRAERPREDGQRAGLGRPDGGVRAVAQRCAMGGPAEQRTTQLRRLLDRRATQHAPESATLDARGGAVVQRAFDTRALEASGLGRVAGLLQAALLHSRGASADLLRLAQGSPLFDVVLAPKDGPPGQTDLHYRDDDTRINIEEAERPNPARARQGGLVMRIGVNLSKVTSEGAALQTLVHEIGVHAAAFAPHLQALLHGAQANQAADLLEHELQDPGLLSGTVQHLLLAGGEAADYEELVNLLTPSLGSLRDDFLAAQTADKAEQQRWASVLAFRIWDAQSEGRVVPPQLQRALLQLGLWEEPEAPSLGEQSGHDAAAPGHLGHGTLATTTTHDTPVDAEDLELLLGLAAPRTAPPRTAPPHTAPPPDFSALFGLATLAPFTQPPVDLGPRVVEPTPWVNPTPVPSQIVLPPLRLDQPEGPPPRLPSLRALGLLPPSATAPPRETDL